MRAGQGGVAVNMVVDAYGSAKLDRATVDTLAPIEGGVDLQVVRSSPRSGGTETAQLFYAAVAGALDVSQEFDLARWEQRSFTKPARERTSDLLRQSF